MISPFVDLVVGARPNLMKASPVAAALDAEGRLGYRIVHTGQHASPALFGDVRADVGLPPVDVSLGLDGQSARDPRTIEGAYRALLRGGRDRPAAVVVFGDVTSTVAAARAAFAESIPIAHVEAGLRCGDPSMAEERNRVETDRLASLLFATEPSAMRHLREERCAGRAILAGNAMIDTLRSTLPRARALRAAAGHGLSPHGYALVTLHRAENVDDPTRLAALAHAICDAARSLPVLWLSHPRATAKLEAAGLTSLLDSAPSLHRSPPLPHRAAISLLTDARVVLTDSGGLSEEAAWLGVPCLILRSHTERPAVTEEGSAVIAGTEGGAIARALQHTLAGPLRGARVRRWDRAAGPHIARVLADAFAQPTRTRPRTANASA